MNAIRNGMPGGRATRELVVFRIGPLLCGVDIDVVQEVNKQLDVTPVYQAPAVVRGLVNLRGQIITILDLRRFFGEAADAVGPKARSVVVRRGDEAIGLLVEDVDDILSAPREDILPMPPHLRGPWAELFEGVYRMSDRLVAVLDVERLWSVDDIDPRSK